MKEVFSAAKSQVTGHSYTAINSFTDVVKAFFSEAEAVRTFSEAR